MIENYSLIIENLQDHQNNFIYKKYITISIIISINSFLKKIINNQKINSLTI